MKVSVIIPARFGSTRLEGKPLADIGGKPMIQHVYEQASKSSWVDSVLVATDDDRIFKAVQSFGGQVQLTSSNHRTGTDRLAEVAQSLPADILVNLQGDLPMLSPGMLGELIQHFCEAQDASTEGIRTKPVMGTLIKELQESDDLYNPNIVKVVTDKKGFALYFSRAPIPHVRDVKTNGKYFKHYGVYIYTREFLLTFTQLSQGPLEQMEKLEQLRALEHGYPILTVETQHQCIEVDTPEDLEKVRTLFMEVNHEGQQT